MKIYINKNNETIGPFEESVVIEKLNNGELRPDDLACKYGDNSWQSLQALIPNICKVGDVNVANSQSSDQIIEERNLEQTVSSNIKMNFALYLLPMIPLIIVYSLSYLRLLLNEKVVDHPSNEWAFYAALFSYFVWFIIHVVFTFKAWIAIDTRGNYQNTIVLIFPYFLPIPILFGLALINSDLRYINNPLLILLTFLILNSIWSIVLFKIYPKNFNKYTLKQAVSNAEFLPTTPYTIYCISICINAFLSVAFPLGVLLSGILYLVFYAIVIAKTANAVNSLMETN